MVVFFVLVLFWFCLFVSSFFFFFLNMKLMALAGSFASSTATVDTSDCLYQHKPLRMVRVVGGGMGKQNRKGTSCAECFSKALCVTIVAYGLYRRIPVSWELNTNRKILLSTLHVQCMTVGCNGLENIPTYEEGNALSSSC